MSDPDQVLCINTGSSSVKGALVAADGSSERHAVTLEHHADPARAVDAVVDELLGRGTPGVVGHRVVHGGADFAAPVLVDDAVLDRLRALVPLAPLHQPQAVAAIEHLRRRLPDVPEVACFDTAFHRRMPESAQRLPLPDRYWDAGIRRYGFHGLSYEYVVGRLGATLGARAVIAHLGGGSSLVALRGGRPVDTTMSLTPGGGLVMATRSGDLDPGVVLALLRLEGNAERVGAVLEEESGLAAISGRGGGIKELVEASRDDGSAREAVDAYVTSVAAGVAGFVTMLGGLDVLVFTGGVGAASGEIRAAIARRLAPLDVDVDGDANAAGAEDVTAAGGRVSVLVVPTDEEAVIARHSRTVAGKG